MIKPIKECYLPNFKFSSFGLVFSIMLDRKQTMLVHSSAVKLGLCCTPEYCCQSQSMTDDRLIERFAVIDRSIGGHAKCPFKNGHHTKTLIFAVIDFRLETYLFGEYLKLDYSAPDGVQSGI